MSLITVPRAVSAKGLQVALVLAASLAVAVLPRFRTATEQWPSGDIDLIIPSGPGGGFDTYARILARAMEAQLDVRVVPRNTPGGDGRRGATMAFNAIPDGRTFAIFNLPGVMEPEIIGEDASYAIGGIDWVGAMAFGQYIVVASADAPFDTIDDLRRTARTVSFTAYGSSGIAANKVLCAEAALDCQIITGYPSNNEALVGVVRGDADASVLPISTAIAFNGSGDLKGLLLMTEREIAEFAGTQTATAAGYPALNELGLLRAFGLPPGVPDDTRLQFARVFNVALADETVAEWAALTGAEFAPMNAAALRVRIDSQRALLTRYRDVIAAGP